jgi:nitrous oxidase accessory protein
MLAALLALWAPGAPRPAHSRPPHRWTVAAGTPLATLTAALAGAGDGDTIVVRAGDYREPELVVARRVTILGDGGPVFFGGDHQIFRVTADSVTLSGLVLQGVSPSATDDRAGIKVIGVRGCRLEGNTLRDTFFGIYLSKVAGCIVRGNRIRGSGTDPGAAGNAIHSWSSDSLRIEGNVVEGHRDGIYFEFTTNAMVRRNISRRALRYGLHFMFSHDCTYTGNQFSDNRSGVAVMYSHGVRMDGNRFERSRGGAAYGLLLKEITDSRLSGNLFEGNSVALYAEGTSRVEVTDNEFIGNGWGVQVMADAQATAFRHNRFDGNSFDVSTNSVNAASLFAGNYWDRYRGYDLDRDGYGDVPYPPVRLFALIVQQNAPALILLRSFFVSLLDAAERVAPVLTPQTMVDARPLMRWSPAAIHGLR